MSDLKILLALITLVIIMHATNGKEKEKPTIERNQLPEGKLAVDRRRVSYPGPKVNFKGEQGLKTAHSPVMLSP